MGRAAWGGIERRDEQGYERDAPERGGAGRFPRENHEGPNLMVRAFVR